VTSRVFDQYYTDQYCMNLKWCDDVVESRTWEKTILRALRTPLKWSNELIKIRLMKPGYRDLWFYPLETWVVFDKGRPSCSRKWCFLSKSAREITKYVRQYKTNHLNGGGEGKSWTRVEECSRLKLPSFIVWRHGRLGSNETGLWEWDHSLILNVTTDGK